MENYFNGKLFILASCSTHLFMELFESSVESQTSLSVTYAMHYWLRPFEGVQFINSYLKTLAPILSVSKYFR